MTGGVVHRQEQKPGISADSHNNKPRDGAGGGGGSVCKRNGVSKQQTNSASRPLWIKTEWCCFVENETFVSGGWKLSATHHDPEHRPPENVFDKAHKMFRFNAHGAGKSFKLTQFSPTLNGDARTHGVVGNEKIFYGCSYRCRKPPSGCVCLKV